MASGTLAPLAAGARSEQRPVASPRLSGAALGWLAGAVLVGLAAAVRVPNLQTLPELSDEMFDAMASLLIARGESLPLANATAYQGPLINYLQAALFRVIGPNLQAPRVMMLVLGVLTVPLVFLCVRRAQTAAAGVLAAAMLAASPVHILVHSHVAWGNCLTPVLTTAAFWLVYRALRQPELPCRRPDSSWNLLPAGLLFGLALQTHPTVFGLLPGTVLALALARPRLFVSRWLWLAGLGMALGYANMLAFNLAHSFESVTFAQYIRARYTGAEPDFGRNYLQNIGALLLGLFRMIGGGVEDRARAGAFLFDPMLLAPALIVLFGLIWAFRRGDRLPLLVTLLDVALLPVVNNRYEPITDGRYLAPLLPLLYGAAAGLLVELWKVGHLWRRRRIVPRAICLVGLASFLLTPLLGVARYNQQNLGTALRTARLWTALDLAERQRPSGTEILLDRDLKRTVLGAGSTVLLPFEYAFTMHGVPYRLLRVTPSSLAAIAEEAGTGDRLLVMERAKRELLDARLNVRQLDAEAPERGERPSVYGLYLVRWGAGG
jgi:4-amino-4-deoxy-L-arabinose transferase-like glycosyltransferase